MRRRYTDQDKWRYDEFRLASPALKLAWVFVHDHCDLAGIWKKEFDVLSFYVGYTVIEDDFVKQFEKKILVFSNHIILNDFISLNYTRLNEKSRPHRSVMNRLKLFEKEEPGFSFVDFCKKNNGIEAVDDTSTIPQRYPNDTSTMPQRCLNDTSTMPQHDLGTVNEKKSDRIFSILKAYEDAYSARYGIVPPRSKEAFALCKTLLSRLGNDAEHVVRFYLSHNDSWFVKQQHALRHCVYSAESLFSQWKRGVQITDSDVKRLSSYVERRSVEDHIDRFFENSGKCK